MMHKDLKDLDRSERSETKMGTLGLDDERLYPSTRVLTTLARNSNVAAKLSSFVQSQESQR